MIPEAEPPRMFHGPRLVFVYNADSGLFNTLADIGHKIFSPETYSCALCAITHGYFHQRKAWRHFVENLPLDCHFLHRDEFLARHPEYDQDLPAIFIQHGDRLQCCIGAEQLETCDNIDTLKQLIMNSCIPNIED